MKIDSRNVKEIQVNLYLSVIMFFLIIIKWKFVMPFLSAYYKIDSDRCYVSMAYATYNKNFIFIASDI